MEEYISKWLVIWNDEMKACNNQPQGFKWSIGCLSRMKKRKTHDLNIQILMRQIWDIFVGIYQLHFNSFMNVFFRSSPNTWSASHICLRCFMHCLPFEFKMENEPLNREPVGWIQKVLPQLMKDVGQKVFDFPLTGTIST